MESMEIVSQCKIIIIKMVLKKIFFLIQIFQQKHLFNCSTLIPIPITLLNGKIEIYVEQMGNYSYLTNKIKGP